MRCMIRGVTGSYFLTFFLRRLQVRHPFDLPGIPTIIIELILDRMFQ